MAWTLGSLKLTSCVPVNFGIVIVVHICRSESLGLWEIDNDERKEFVVHAV